MMRDIHTSLGNPTSHDVEQESMANQSRPHVPSGCFHGETVECRPFFMGDGKKKDDSSAAFFSTQIKIFSFSFFFDCVFSLLY